MDLINIFSVLIVALFSGVLGSLTGLGGASIITPILVALGLPLKYSIANAVISIIATSAGSSAAYVRDRITNIRAAMYMEIFTIIGGIVGAYLTLMLPAVVLYFFFASFLILVLFLSREKGSLNDVSRDRKIDRFSRWLNIRGEYYDPGDKIYISYMVRRAHIGGPMMMIAGVAAGSLGIGAGAFKTAIQEGIMGLPPKVATTTSNFIIGMTGLAAASVYISSGYVDPVLAASMTLGTAVGSIIGSKILPIIRGRTVRILSMIITVYLIIQMIYKGVSQLWI
ncbi:MAG: sulfite exporter TauE/SafE family protein [Desulfurococcales archaeon]|nr:sulfite exporter TauE/SafE family protein [Desulfurococcales archaeon]